MNNGSRFAGGSTRILFATIAGLAAVAVVYLLGARFGLPAWLAGDRDAAALAGNGPLMAGDIDPATGRRVLYWHDPMVPGQRFDRPGRSPFMNMALVPVYEGAGADGSAVAIDPRVQQNLGIRTALVTRGTIAPRVEAVGNIEYNERDRVVVEARAQAFVEELHVRATLDAVRAGDPLAELYVPSWIAVQEEYLAVAGMQGENLAPLIDAARQRMRQAGMTDAQIRDVEANGRANARHTLLSPIDGVIDELGAREGMTVMPGDVLFRINGLDTVWVTAEVPESQAMLVRPGAVVTARSAAMPNLQFPGSVQAILPSIDSVTRTLQARIEIDNPGRSLVPGMFVSVALAGPAREGLLIPTEALIETGRRTIVIRADPTGTFSPVEVESGLEADGQSEILSGLNDGERIVISGQFLIDSEASLRSVVTRMGSAGDMSDQPVTHTGEGRIDAVSRGRVTLSHGPIPSMQWGEMTMTFDLPADFDDAGLAVGDTVDLRFVMSPAGRPEIVSIDPVSGDPP